MCNCEGEFALDVDEMKGLLWHLAAVVLLFLTIAGGWKLFTAPKNVDYYYLSQGSGENHTATCVYAHWTWHPDEVSFCTDDRDKALDFVTRGNASLKK